MTADVQPDRVAMSQRERDVLKVMRGVLDGTRTQAEAARLVGRSTRRVRRRLRRLAADGDGALVHGLRGRPSNHRSDPDLRRRVLRAYRQRYPDFGPTLASEKLAGEGLPVEAETLRRWLLAEGLWERKRQRDPHRARRPRRSCFGELVQMDASIHDWLEGRGESVVLIARIDDATSRAAAQFYPAGTVETHLDLPGTWVRQYGRPRAIYTDRHSIFEPQGKGKALPDGVTQFGRALGELDVELIRAHSPQAEGRVERLFGTLQDRWVKERRLSRVRTIDQANRVLGRPVPEYNRRSTRVAGQPTDAHRRPGPGHRLGGILSVQAERVVSNDYVVRFESRSYQLLKPVYAGERGGRVVIERRPDGTLWMRSRGHYLNYREAAAGTEPEPAPAPVAGPSTTRSSGPPRPAENHPWRTPFKQPN